MIMLSMVVEWNFVWNLYVNRAVSISYLFEIALRYFSLHRLDPLLRILVFLLVSRHY